MKKLMTEALCIVAVMSLCITKSYADVESENAILARIHYELEELHPLINEAEKQQPKSTRIHFDYKKLRSDLQKIETGVEEQFNQTTIEPRSIEPVAGDYVHTESLKP